MTGNISITKVPPMRDVILKVIQFDPEEPKAGSFELMNLVSEDQGICGKILKVSNSALYGSSKQITNVKDAIARLGLKTVKMLVLAMSSEEIERLYSIPIYQKYLQEYHFLTAFIARKLARKIKGDFVKDDEAFIAGLFQKIGMTLLGLNESLRYTKVLTEFDNGTETLIDLEKSVFDTNHVEIGKVVLAQWNLPKIFNEIIGEKITDSADIVNHSARMRLIAISDLLALRVIKEELPPQKEEMLQALAENLGVSGEIPKFTSEFLKSMLEDPLYKG